MVLKVAIVGLSQSSRHLAPWGKSDWELWGLAWDTERYRMHRTFEMHELPQLKNYKTAAYIEELQYSPRLYMHDAYLEIPGSIRYPFEDVAGTTGDYWCSSIGYMLALAIHEGAEEIAVYGVDMRGTEEYAYQRPNCEYLIGLARGKGITVHIPDQSPLCKFVSDPDFAYVGRYGRS